MHFVLPGTYFTSFLFYKNLRRQSNKNDNTSLAAKGALPHRLQRRTTCNTSKEQTEPIFLAEIRPEAEIRFRLGRNQNPIYKFRFRQG